jgi:hypothetical protein
MKQAIYSKPQSHSLKTFFQQQGITLNDLGRLIARSVYYCHVRLNGYKPFLEAEETALQELAKSLKVHGVSDNAKE